ncbi:hypothetical protein [Bacillus sp. RAR_GA_16]|uniref:hypothetical protein n=1 Tax=Bacillus sp. RAR_GA_16 TaxID=2876774 RepID=UPI001CCEE933|nr:hypothetical protein [Bacillus sp. RAR_GA_16]MCA0173235.1 hypothetical protein [Bacillus sp. RAR_GA_16]
MSKSLQAYFTTENDAESAKADLQTYSVSQLSVEHIPEDQKLNIDVPIPGQGTATPAGANNDLFFSNETPTGKQEENADPSEKADHKFRYLLAFETDESDDTDLREVVSKHNGAMEK